MVHTVSSESRATDYWELLKPRVMYLVVFTAIVGMLLAPGKINPIIAITAILCTAVGSGAAGAINMWYERSIDSLMHRTKNRPLPGGRVDPSDALAFGIVLGVGSVTVMALCVNVTAGFYLGIAIAFYTLIYTVWLKPRTPQNIVIGGAAGALPPVIGWASVTGGTTIEPWIMFVIIFMWTPPHFWALALEKSDEYKTANLPMMPVVRGEKRTQYEILLYTFMLILTTLLPYSYGFLGEFYFAVAALLGLGYLYYSVMIILRPGRNSNMSSFVYSIFYLFLLFSSMVIDQRIFQ